MADGAAGGVEHDETRQRGPMSRVTSWTRADGRTGFTRYASNPAVSACVRRSLSSKAVTAIATIPPAMGPEA